MAVAAAAGSGRHDSMLCRAAQGGRQQGGRVAGGRASAGEVYGVVVEARRLSKIKMLAGAGARWLCGQAGMDPTARDIYGVTRRPGLSCGCEMRNRATYASFRRAPPAMSPLHQLTVRNRGQMLDRQTDRQTDKQDRQDRQRTANKGAVQQSARTHAALGQPALGRSLSM